MSSKVYIQYGCGWNAPYSWRNFDASPTLLFERIPLLGRLYTKNTARFPKNVEYGDIVKGLPVQGCSCKGVYCSHVLEHLSLEDCSKALMNTWRILEDGGVFRFVLPDLEFAIRKYIDYPKPTAAIDFLKETGLGREIRNRKLKSFFFNWIGNSGHLWGWDYKSLANELANSGFMDIRRAQFGDSNDPMFNVVEQKERWDNCLGIECRKQE